MEEEPYEKIVSEYSEAYVLRNYIFLKSSRPLQNGDMRIQCRDYKRGYCRASALVRGDSVYLDSDCHNHAPPDIEAFKQRFQRLIYGASAKKTRQKQCSESFLPKTAASSTTLVGSPEQIRHPNRRSLLPQARPKIAPPKLNFASSSRQTSVSTSENSVSSVCAGAPTFPFSATDMMSPMGADYCGFSALQNAPTSATASMLSATQVYQEVPAGNRSTFAQQPQVLPLNLGDENAVFGHFVGVKLAKLNAKAAAKAQAEIAQVLSAATVTSAVEDQFN